MALGAQRTTVILEVVRGAMVLTVVGVVLGVAAAIGLTRLLTSWFFQVSPFDATTFVLTALLIGITALVASCVPALRGASVDPSVVLRGE
jgi:ABC-type antimicrobial peptide transport system permease subunit